MKVRLTLVAVLVAVGIGLVCLSHRPKQTSASVPATADRTAQIASAHPASVAASVAAAAVAALPATNETMSVRGTLPYVLTSAAPLGKRLRLAAEAAGAKTVSVLSRNSLLIEADAAARMRLSSDGRFSEIEEFAPTGKIQPELAKLVSAGAAFVDVSVISLSAADRGIVQSCLENGGGAMLEGCINEGDTLRARLPAALVASLAVRGDVRWMEKFERPRFMNDIAVDEPQMNVREVWDAHGLKGDGQVITTSDTGIDTGVIATMHEDLRNRVKGIKVVSGCNATDSNGHGTHTAGSIVGDGTKSAGQIRGPAHGASLYAWFCCGTDGYVYTPTAMDELYRNNGAWPASIHSASWGMNVDGEYTSESRKHDLYVWNNPEFLPVFSAGNEGCNRYGTVIRKCSIGSPGTAKNVLTVGATQNARKDGDGGWGNGNPKKTAIFSSRGPCCDGRTKPDIAAPGMGVLSTRSHGVDYSYGNYNDFYAYDSGTSMACPLTAGAVALVRQWLVEKKGFADEDGTRPTAALMKAVITGGAKDAPVPNNDQGWGRVDLENTLFPTNAAVKLVDRIPFQEGEVFEYLIETTNAAPLDVQLCWVDYPGSASGSQSTPKLVNDLDLTVESLDGAGGELLGNGGATADNVNNMESVRIASAKPSKYLITVTCRKVLYDYSEGGAAALYVRGAFDPEAKPTGLDRVRIRRDPDTTYITLDEALAAVQDGDTVEILRPIALKQPATIGVNCTIVATNDDAFASAVNCLSGGLTIEGGARVLFQDVVFTNAASVAVAAGGVAALSGTVSVGPVTTSDETGVELAGEISRNVIVRSPNTGVGAPFGTFSCEYPVAASSAKFFENAANEELGGIAVSDTGKFVWGAAEVPDDAARVKLFVGGQSQNFRSIHTLFKFVTTDAEIAVLKDCGFSLPESITNRIALVGGAPGVTVTASNVAGFVISGGTLAVSNLTLTGLTSDALFRVGESDSGLPGELILGEGASLRDVVVSSAGYCGAIRVLNGSAKLGEGSSVTRCRALGSDSYGGAVYAYGKNARVLLDGTTIKNCSSMKRGGGCAFWYGARLEVSGATCVKGNFVFDDNTGGDVEDDIYCKDPVQVVGSVTSPAGSIGVAPTNREGEGDAFAEYDPAAVTDPSASAAAFFNMKTSGLVAVADEEEKTFVWQLAPASRTCDESMATVRVIYPDAVTNFYETIEIAFSDLQGDCRVELMKALANLDGNLTVSNAVTLTSDPALGESALLGRTNGMITVRTGAALTVTNLTLSGCYYSSRTAPETFAREKLVNVEGGSLVLEKDGGVRLFDGDGSRDASAIVVYQGTFTMKDGSFVDACRNNYVDGVKGTETGTGGGVLIDVGSTAYLMGGKIVKCAATLGGGLSLDNKSTAYVSGSFCATNNTDLSYSPSDLRVADLSVLVLAEPLAADSQIGRIVGYQADTNLAAVVRDWASQWTGASLKADAEKFFSNAQPGVVGVAVTNATADALIVWTTALQGGKYVDPADPQNVYGEVTDDMPTQPPILQPAPPGPDYATPGPIAFTNIAYGTDSVTLILTGAVQWCNYRLFATNSLEGGFAITNSAGELVVAPVTNFQWRFPDNGIQLTFPTNATRRFWKATAERGEIPAE